MAMRLYTEAEFIEELVKRGLTPTDEYISTGKARVFTEANGHGVLVPCGRDSYPDWILDDLIAHLGDSWKGDSNIETKCYGVDKEPHLKVVKKKGTQD